MPFSWYQQKGTESNEIHRTLASLKWPCASAPALIYFSSLFTFHTFLFHSIASIFNIWRVNEDTHRGPTFSTSYSFVLFCSYDMIRSSCQTISYEFPFILEWNGGSAHTRYEQTRTYYRISVRTSKGFNFNSSHQRRCGTHESVGITRHSLLSEMEHNTEASFADMNVLANRYTQLGTEFYIYCCRQNGWHCRQPTALLEVRLIYSKCLEHW